MEKIFTYLTQNAASALGITILTGLTVSSSAVGATKIVQSIQVKKPNAAVVKNHVVDLPDQASSNAKTVILAKFGSQSATPVVNENGKKTSQTPSPTVSASKSPTPTSVPNQNANKCIVDLFGKQYDVTPLQTGHSGGNIFTCGTDMTAIYQAQHGTNLSRVAQYLVTEPATGGASTTLSPSVTQSQVKNDDDKFEDEKEEMEERQEREKKSFEKRRESENTEHEVDDDIEDRE